LIDDFRGSNWAARMLDFRHFGNIVFDTNPVFGAFCNQAADRCFVSKRRGAWMLREPTKPPAVDGPAVEYNRQQSARSGHSILIVEVKHAAA
jgi:hypothetical protein